MKYQSTENSGVVKVLFSNREHTMKVHIIGGGVIGLSTAFYLLEKGFEVVIIDKTNLTEGTSHCNAGMIVPSHFTPLAAPGVIAKGLRWMFDSKSPFFIKPRLSFELAAWLWQFYRNSTPQKVAAAAPVLKKFNELSKELYKTISEKEGFSFNFEEKGLLTVFKTTKAKKEEIETAEAAHCLGIEAQILSREEVHKLEKEALPDVLGGVFYPGDAHLHPNLFIKQLVKYLKSQGVQFLTRRTVTGFNIKSGKINEILFETGDSVEVKKVVLAAGSWSAQVLKKIGLKILLQDGKGYSFTIKKPALSPIIPTILAEAKVAITPMGTDLRIGGTLEISNFSNKINTNRLKGIEESLSRYYPSLATTPSMLKNVQHGFRPCSPDGLPYIGKSKKYENLVIATGHSMMGMSLGPATGKLIAEIISGKKNSVDISLFKPERFA